MKVFIHNQGEREILAVVNCLAFSQAEDFAVKNFVGNIEVVGSDKGLYHVFNKTEKITLEGADNAAD